MDARKRFLPKQCVVKKKREARDDTRRDIVMGKAKLEFIARLTTSDGKVIERRVEAADGIPVPEDFDMETKEGFLEQFNAFEMAALEARNKIGADITESYLDEISKKNE